MRKQGMNKIIAMLLVIIMAMAILTACGQKAQEKVQETEKGGVTEESSSGSETTGEEASSQPEELQLPIVKEPIELTMWATLRKAATTMNDFNQKSCFQELERITGIRIKWLHPPVGQEQEQFNLMIASNDLPDLIWGGYFTNIEEAIAQKQIIPLNDLIAKYAPNFTKLLEKYPTLKKSIMTDSGDIFGFPFVQTFLQAAGTGPQGGFQIRKDWLDKLGLPIPETLDDWKKVLKAFKENDPNGNGKPDEIPFGSDGNGRLLAFLRAFGVRKDFFMKGGPTGTISYGPIEPAFKDAIAFLRDLYAEGLIDKDYLTTDLTLFESKLTNHLIGATSGNMFGNLGKWTTLMRNDPDFLLWPAPNPKRDENSIPYFEMDRLLSLHAGEGFITTANKYPVESVKWFDFGYSEEGQLLYNFGKEGVSYEMVNGYPQYTDEVLNNPDGLSITDALAKHSMASDEANFVQDPRYYEQIVGATPAQRQAARTWGIGLEPSLVNNLQLPPIQLTREEAERSATIMNDINTYRDEMIDKFITGQEPLEKFDEFVEQIKAMGIDEAIRIRQDALERWKKRGGIEFEPVTEEAKLDYSKAKLVTQKGYDALDPDLK